MDWNSFLKDTKNDYGKLSKEIPNTFHGFDIMGKEAKKIGLLSEVSGIGAKRRKILEGLGINFIKELANTVSKEIPPADQGNF